MTDRHRESTTYFRRTVKGRGDRSPRHKRHVDRAYCSDSVSLSFSFLSSPSKRGSFRSHEGGRLRAILNKFSCLGYWPAVNLTACQRACGVCDIVIASRIARCNRRRGVHCGRRASLRGLSTERRRCPAAYALRFFRAFCFLIPRKRRICVYMQTLGDDASLEAR